MIVQFPLLHGIVATDNPDVAFAGVEFALLVGSRPRGPGMERKELLEANAQIFSLQGKSLNDHAAGNVRILVVGNPANTNCLIAQRNAPDIDSRQFTAMTRLDHNRALTQLGRKTGNHVTAIKNLIIWGNHSATQYPDVSHASVAGQRAMDLVDQEWIEQDFIPVVQQRGAEVINARGLSSAASAANAAVAHMRDWVSGTDGEIVSMGICSDGSYGIEKGLIYSFPCICDNGHWSIVDDLEISAFSQLKMSETEAELIEERDAVRDLLQ